MRRIMGILAIVLGVWIGAEVLTQGVDQAFGGVFARFGLSQKLSKSDGERINPDGVPLPAAQRYRGAFDRGIERVDEALEKQ